MDGPWSFRRPTPPCRSASSTFGSQGGTSLTIVQDSKLAVDPVLVPVALVVSCLDKNDVQTRARLNFLNAADGEVVMGDRR